MHPSTSNSLLALADSGNSANPGSAGLPEQHTAAGQAQDPGQTLTPLPPSLLTCASTILESPFDAEGEAAGAAVAAECLGTRVRMSQLDDVPEADMHSPRNQARCESPFKSVQR